jgi:hypothetical protein
MFAFAMHCQVLGRGENTFAFGTEQIVHGSAMQITRVLSGKLAIALATVQLPLGTFSFRRGRGRYRRLYSCDCVLGFGGRPTPGIDLTAVRRENRVISTVIQRIFFVVLLDGCTFLISRKAPR